MATNITPGQARNAWPSGSTRPYRELQHFVWAIGTADDAETLTFDGIRAIHAAWQPSSASQACNATVAITTDSTTGIPTSTVTFHTDGSAYNGFLHLWAPA